MGIANLFDLQGNIHTTKSQSHHYTNEPKGKVILLLR